jgi:hypothetical protein
VKLFLKWASVMENELARILPSYNLNHSLLWIITNTIHCLFQFELSHLFMFRAYQQSSSSMARPDDSQLRSITITISIYIYIYIYMRDRQSDSLATGTKLLSTKICYWDNDLKLYTHIPGTIQNRTCSQSMLKTVSFHTQAHLNAFLQ